MEQKNLFYQIYLNEKRFQSDFSKHSIRKWKTRSGHRLFNRSVPNGLYFWKYAENMNLQAACNEF